MHSALPSSSPAATYALISVPVRNWRGLQESATHDEDLSVVVSGRRMTNIGCFRAHAEAHLRAHPLVNQDMTLLVRRLEPSDKGLPLELYAFTADTRWAVYENVQAYIFDHLLPVVSQFDQRVFQSPSGHDVQRLQAR